MYFFRHNNRNSSHIAKNRLKLLLVSERLDCSPRTMVMVKNDMIQTLNKYMLVDEDEVSISISQSPAVMTARIPLKSTLHGINFS